MKLSLVVPVYNEKDNLPALYAEISAKLGSLDWELILVDDGSRDGSWPLLADFAHRDPRVRAIRLRRNFGQTAAMAAGFDAATGEVVVPLDADLQNDPADIPQLLAKQIGRASWWGRV